MNEPSVEQYEMALKTLSERQIEILHVLHNCAKSTANAKDLAVKLNYSNFRPVNRQIGGIGKLISQHIGVIPGEYQVGKPAYYSLVGPYTEDGWVMNKNLIIAINMLNQI